MKSSPFTLTLLLSVSLSLFVHLKAQADEPLLSLVWEGGQKIFKRQELLKNPTLQSIRIVSDPVYGGHPRGVKAFLLKVIFEQLPAGTLNAESVLQFRCLDGFSAP